MRKDFLMVGDKFFYEIMGHYYRYNVIKLGNGSKVLFPVEKDSPVLNISSIDDYKMTVVYLSSKNRHYKYYKMLEDIAPKIEGYDRITIPDKLFKIFEEVTAQMCNTRLPENETDEENMIKVFCRTEIDRMLVRQSN